MSSSLVGAGQALLRGLLHLVYPAHCLVCGRALPGERSSFCPSCEHALFHDPLPACPRCASTVGPFAVNEGRCSLCRDEPFLFERAFRLGPYADLRRDVVLRLKHSQAEGLAECLGEHWGRRFREALLGEGVQDVVPVPLHWWKRWRRGYNQAAALAHGLAVGLGLPSRPWALRRLRRTQAQSALTASERADNVRGAFRVRGSNRFTDRCVLLVDDVLTTGSTCSECARALLEAGAARVVVAALARAGK